MSGQWGPGRGRLGTTLQAGLPKRSMTITRGMLANRPLRAAVFAVYTQSDPQASSPTTSREGVRGVWVDVYVYGKHPGPLYRVAVSQGGGLHEGSVWIPRPVSVAVSSNESVTPEFPNISPENWDGDHVLIDFAEGNASLPFVSQPWTHPNTDFGASEGGTLGPDRLLALVADGAPRLQRHRGIAWGVTHAADFLIDATRSNTGAHVEGGKEAPHSTGLGSLLVKLGAGAKMFVAVAAERALELTGVGASARLAIGTGARHAASVEELKALYEVLYAKMNAFDGHRHQMPATAVTGTATPSGTVTGTTAPGVSGGPTPVIAAPPWDPAIESDHLSFPVKGG